MSFLSKTQPVVRTQDSSYSFTHNNTTIVFQRFADICAAKRFFRIHCNDRDANHFLMGSNVTSYYRR